jgi:aspartyl-tRNA(Asn)/glutamyl-tRNA(Gln) amidotransferase subunit C
MIRLTGLAASTERGICPRLSLLFTFISFCMPLTPDQLQRIALLARIAVSPEEARGVTDRLNQVLGLIDQLQALDTRGIEPMSHALDAQAAVQQRLRPDAVTEPDRRADYQAVAPSVERGLYLVPKVIE